MMRGRTRETLWLCSMAAVLCLTVVSCARPIQEPVSMPDAEIPPLETREPDGSGEAGTWVGEFRTRTTEEVVLVVDPRFRLYVLDGELVYEGEQGSRVLFRWKADLCVEALSAGPHLLIGIDDERRSPWSERWLAIDLKAVPVPTVTSIATFFGPAQLLDVRYHDETELLFVTAANAASYSEFYYDPGRSDFVTINAVTAPGLTWEQRDAVRPERTASVRPFDSVMRHRPGDSDVWAFEDDRGTIVFRPESPHAERFFQLAMEDVRMMPGINGTDRLLGRFRAPGGGTVAAFVGSNRSSYMPGADRLFESGWMEIEHQAFFRRTQEGIELLRYRYGEEDSPESRFYPVSEPYIARTGSLVEYRVDGERRWLSLFDLMDVIPAAPIQELWLRHAAVDERGTGERPFRWERPTVSVTVSQIISRYAEAPEHVVRAVPEPMGDYGLNKISRLIDGSWYVLADDQLYVVRDGEAENVGELPVRIAYIAGGGVSSRTAQDFLRFDGQWVVADTFGDRVIKLNDSFEVTAASELPVPNELRVDADGLWVRGLDGWTLLDRDLRPVRRLPVDFEPTAAEALQLDADAVLIDVQSGITWAYRDQWLHQMCSDGGSRSLYVGWVHNGYAQVRLIPVQDQVLLLFDDRAHLFGRDGQWRRTIRFARESPDAFGWMACVGENSWHLDHDRGRLYLVQGYRVLEIGLDTGSVQTLFMQYGWNLGSLVCEGGRLYVTATVGRDETHHGPAEYVELLVYDTETQRLTRWLLSGHYHSEGLTEDGRLSLWRFDDGPNRTRSGRSAVVSPGALTVSD